MTDSATSASATIIIPGPELSSKIKDFAAKLSKEDKTRQDQILAKLSRSADHRRQFLYAFPSHVFYPFFLQQLTEFRAHPELREAHEAAALQKKQAEQERAAIAGSSPTPTTTTTTLRGGLVRVEGGTAHTPHNAEQDHLRELEEKARQYQTDPYPSQYSLHLRGGTLEVPQLEMELIASTAQYVSKYGDAFLKEVEGKQHRSGDVSLRFVLEDDPRHELFHALVESYRRILHAKDDETEERLVDHWSQPSFVRAALEEKRRYAKAAMAREQAALLTDDVLKQRLHWGYFKVLQTFKLSDLLLDGPVPPTARSQQSTLMLAAPYAAVRDAGTEGDAKRFKSESASTSDDPTAAPPLSGPPSYEPTFMSGNLVRPG